MPGHLELHFPHLGSLLTGGFVYTSPSPAFSRPPYDSGLSALSVTSEDKTVFQFFRREEDEMKDLNFSPQKLNTDKACVSHRRQKL